MALKTLEIYERDKVFEHAAAVGEYLQRRLREFADHPLVGEIRGAGLLAGIELVADRETRAPFSDNRAGAAAQQACQDQGLMVRALAGNTIAFCPPLVITESQIDELIEKLGRALDETVAAVAT